MATRGVHCGISYDNILYTALEINYDVIGLWVDVITIGGSSHITHFFIQQSTGMGGNERDSYERMRMYVHHWGSDTIYCTEMIQQYFQVQYCFFYY